MTKIMEDDDSYFCKKKKKKKKLKQFVQNVKYSKSI